MRYAAGKINTRAWNDRGTRFHFFRLLRTCRQVVSDLFLSQSTCLRQVLIGEGSRPLSECPARVNIKRVEGCYCSTHEHVDVHTNRYIATRTHACVCVAYELEALNRHPPRVDTRNEEAHASRKRVGTHNSTRTSTTLVEGGLCSLRNLSPRPAVRHSGSKWGVN